MTAEGRLQAMILLALPPAMYCVLLLISRKYALELLEHPNMILGSLISMAVGALWIRKIVNFDFTLGEICLRYGTRLAYAPVTPL